MPNNSEVIQNVQPFPEVEAHSQLFASTSFPHPSLINSYEPGTTEPWIAEAVCGLLKATGGTKVLETGGFIGTTSAWLLLTLKQMGGGHLAVCEIDRERRKLIEERLEAFAEPDWKTRNDDDGVGFSTHGDVLQYVNSLPHHSLDFVWLDDDHHPVHVEREINALWTKVRPGGIICFHDVVGSTAHIGTLVKKYGGIVLDFARLGPAGGLGVLTIPA